MSLDGPAKLSRRVGASENSWSRRRATFDCTLGRNRAVMVDTAFDGAEKLDTS